MQIIEDLKKKGTSVSILSKSTGIPAGRIYKWLSGKATPKHADVIKLEDFLNEKSATVKDAPGLTLEMQLELVASSRVILSLLAEWMAAQLNRPSSEISSIYRKMVKDEAAQMIDELRKKAKV